VDNSVAALQLGWSSAAICWMLEKPGVARYPGARLIAALASGGIDIRGVQE
jgi:hypothetical protein